MKICTKKTFTFSYPVTLTFDLEFSRLERYVSTKLELSMVFLFQEDQMHWTDRWTGRWTGCKA